jgi:putative hydrolase of the HAD superfamily
MLKGIPLRKALYTNGTSDYGQRVLRALGIADQFERVIGIQEVGLLNKVNRDAYERMLGLLGTKATSCIMVEDFAPNLRAAKELGMTTVLVGGGVSEDADLAVANVLGVGPMVDRLLADG